MHAFIHIFLDILKNEDCSQMYLLPSAYTPPHTHRDTDLYNY